MCCLTVLKLAFIVMDLLDSSNRLGWHILSIFQEYILRCKGLKWLLEKVTVGSFPVIIFSIVYRRILGDGAFPQGVESDKINILMQIGIHLYSQ